MTKRTQAWALQTEDSTRLYSCNLSLLLTLNGDSIILGFFVLQLLGHPPSLPHACQRRFSAPLQSTTTNPLLTFTTYRSLSDSSTLALDQPYTKYFMHILYGYSHHLCSFDNGDTTGSFSGPRNVSLSNRLPRGWSKSRWWISQFIPFLPSSLWVSPLSPPILPLPYLPCSFWKGELFVSLLHGWAADYHIVSLFLTPHVTALRGTPCHPHRYTSFKGLKINGLSALPANVPTS